MIPTRLPKGRDEGSGTAAPGGSAGTDDREASSVGVTVSVNVEFIVAMIVGFALGGGVVYAILRGRFTQQRFFEVENLIQKKLTGPLDELRRHVDKYNEARISDRTKVIDSVERLITETSGLRAILHNPQMRGAWGEQHLRNVINEAGMKLHVDYIEQGTVAGGLDGRKAASGRESEDPRRYHGCNRRQDATRQVR